MIFTDLSSMIFFATLSGTFSYDAKCMDDCALPWVFDLKSVVYQNISDNGTFALMTAAFPLLSCPWIIPLLELRSPITSPT